jgi:hypothetical protein
MKVKEFIELLKQFPEDLEIVREYDSVLFTPDKPKRSKMVEDECFADTFYEVTDKKLHEENEIIECVVL